MINHSYYEWNPTIFISKLLTFLLLDQFPMYVLQVMKRMQLLQLLIVEQLQCTAPSSLVILILYHLSIETIPDSFMLKGEWTICC